MSRENSRWTYAHGSRPEGVILYDTHPNGGSVKLQSWHDTDPARGQVNAFDLVRLHLFGALDTDADLAKPVTERPSYRGMCKLALDQPELRSKVAADDFALLGDLGPLTPEESIEQGAAGLARRIKDVLDDPTTPEWLIEDVLERNVIAIMAGPRGSFKSFLSLDWSMRVAVECNEPVYVISGEGGDFDRRAQAWLIHHRPELSGALDSIPLYVVERRLDLSTKEGVELIRRDCNRLNVRPKLFVLDTFSKLSGGLDENDNTAVKAFIGRLDNGIKRAFGATVLLVAHTGHSTQSRARGASALAADTDAEYIVARQHGAVSVSRERFKSSPELVPLYYQPRVVELGRLDAKGKMVTSLALDPAAPPEAPKGRRAPSGLQKQALEVVEKISLGGESVAIADVVEATVLKIPKPDGRDTRRRTVNRAIASLVENGWLFLDGEDRVMRQPLKPASNEAFGL